MRRDLTSARPTGPAVTVLLGLALALAAGCGAGTQVPAGGASHSATRSAGHTASLSPSPSCGASNGPAFPMAPHGMSLNAVQFVSASVGWVVGSDRILHTADGGLHWVTQYLTSQKAGLATVDFTDASHGWVVGASTILTTADGGAHWHALPEPCAPVRAVHFVSPADGIAVAGGSRPYLGVSASGGVVLATDDGGEHWRRLPAPPDVQTACLSDLGHGWLGAGGSIYGTVNGGRTWTLAVRGPGQPGGPPGGSAIAEVECAGPGAAWAELIGPGAAMSHAPQIGYHTSGRTWRPIFAEQFFPHPGVSVRAEAPGVYPGPFSAISPAQAVFIGFCAPCSMPATPRLEGTAPMDIATDGGAMLLRRGVVARLAEANGTAFVTADDGWVVGTQTRYPLSGRGRARTVSRIMHTADGGRSWQVQYALGP